jgi:elongation factor Ts
MVWIIFSLFTMADITASLIKELRERTGVGMGECKNALIQADGDIEMAIEVLRKKGISHAAKRAANETREGVIRIDADATHAYVVGVTCETDFVSKNSSFSELVDRCMTVTKSEPDSAKAIEACESIKTEYSLKIGENMKVKYAHQFTGEALASYVHMTGKIGSIVIAKAWADAEKLRSVALHIAASSPLVLSPDDVSSELVAKEKEIALEQMKQDPKNEGKPQDILEKIIDGKMRKFKEENALLTQPLVMQPDITVGAYIGAGVIVSFFRFEI